MKFIFDTSLVLYLPLHESDGNPIVSKDTYGHIGTVSGADWTPRGGSFDGADDYITTMFKPGALTSLTVEAWARFNVTAIDQDIFHTVSSAEERAVSLRSNGCEIQPQGTPVGSSWHSWTIGTLLADVFWHLSMTWDGAGVKGYLNGRQDGDANTITGNLNAAGQSTEIGKHPSNGWWMNGIIGEVRFYNRALTGAEIMHNYLATKWRYQ